MSVEYIAEAEFRILKNRIYEFFLHWNSARMSSDIAVMKNMLIAYENVCTKKIVSLQKDSVLSKEIANSLLGELYALLENCKIEDSLTSIAIQIRLREFAFKIYNLKSEEPKTITPFTYGNTVKILKATYGWGNAKEGDIGIIEYVDSIGRYVSLSTNGNQNMLFDFSDIELCLPSKIDSEDLVAMRILENYKDCYSSLAIYMRRDLNIVKEKISTLQMNLEKIREEYTTRKIQTDIISNQKIPYSDDLLLAQLKELLATSYEGIDVYEGTITCLTKPIHIKYDFEDKTIKNIVPMGRYIVRIDLLKTFKEITIKNQLDEDKAESYPHPHVSQDNIPCFGTYKNKIEELYRNSDYLNMLKIIHDFLSSVYPAGWYLHIVRWAGVNDLCLECFHREDNCVCDNDEEEETVCNTCSERIEECICYHCPANNDESFSNFPDKSCIQCPHLIKDITNGAWKCNYGNELQFQVSLNLHQEPIVQPGTARYTTA